MCAMSFESGMASAIWVVVDVGRCLYMCRVHSLARAMRSRLAMMKFVLFFFRLVAPFARSTRRTARVSYATVVILMNSFIFSRCTGDLPWLLGALRHCSMWCTAQSLGCVSVLRCSVPSSPCSSQRCCSIQSLVISSMCPSLYVILSVWGEDPEPFFFRRETLPSNHSPVAPGRVHSSTNVLPLESCASPSSLRPTK